MLRTVEPHVTWGFPNLKSARELILKCGQAKIKDKTVPLIDIAVSEEHLGGFGAICLEDFIHETAFPGSISSSSLHSCAHLSVACHASKTRVGFLREMGSPHHRVNVSGSSSVDGTRPGAGFPKALCIGSVFCCLKRSSVFGEDYFMPSKTEDGARRKTIGMSINNTSAQPVPCGEGLSFSTLAALSLRSTRAIEESVALLCPKQNRNKNKKPNSNNNNNFGEHILEVL